MQAAPVDAEKVLQFNFVKGRLEKPACNESPSDQKGFQFTQL